MHQTRKSCQWYHGFALSFTYSIRELAGVDKDSGLYHPVAVTPANVYDPSPVAELLH